MSEVGEVKGRYRLARLRPVNSHIRTWRLIFILCMLALFLPSVSMGISGLLQDSHWWGIGVQPSTAAQGAWKVIWSDRGLSTDYNILVGDQILKADGRIPTSSVEINQANELEIRSPGAISTHSVRWHSP